jgi:hypothetical protein
MKEEGPTLSHIQKLNLTIIICIKKIPKKVKQKKILEDYSKIYTSIYFLNIK